MPKPAAPRRIFPTKKELARLAANEKYGPEGETLDHTGLDAKKNQKYMYPAVQALRPDRLVRRLGRENTDRLKAAQARGSTGTKRYLVPKESLGTTAEGGYLMAPPPTHMQMRGDDLFSDVRQKVEPSVVDVGFMTDNMRHAATFTDDNMRHAATFTDVAKAWLGGYSLSRDGNSEPERVFLLGALLNFIRLAIRKAHIKWLVFNHTHIQPRWRTLKARVNAVRLKVGRYGFFTYLRWLRRKWFGQAPLRQVTWPGMESRFNAKVMAYDVGGEHSPSPRVLGFTLDEILEQAKLDGANLNTVLKGWLKLRFTMTGVENSDGDMRAARWLLESAQDLTRQQFEAICTMISSPPLRLNIRPPTEDEIKAALKEAKAEQHRMAATLRAARGEWEAKRKEAVRRGKCPYFCDEGMIYGERWGGADEPCPRCSSPTTDSSSQTTATSPRGTTSRRIS